MRDSRSPLVKLIGSHDLHLPTFIGFHIVLQISGPLAAVCLCCYAEEEGWKNVALSQCTFACVRVSFGTVYEGS